jgi:cytochrome c peroxidase
MIELIAKMLRVWLLLGVAGVAIAQAPPPPLGLPPVPLANPLTEAKINLGKTLFWEEQLSVTGTIACGSCHRPGAAGADPRTGAHISLNSFASTHPGPDGVLGTPDDVRASMGVPAHGGDGQYTMSPRYGFAAQVGGRKSPSAINAAYSSQVLFWDGRAGSSFADPITGLVLIPQGAALENQALMPLLDTSEMAPSSAVIADVPARIVSAKPLALASSVPRTLSTWIGTRSYPELFNEAFGSTDVSATRIAMAIASYERTLNSNQTPFDAFNGGDNTALTAQEQRGLGVFRGTDCAGCHAGALLSDNSFRYLGLRPSADDLGRFNQSANNANRGAFKVPSLRNVALRAPFMHTGRFMSLEEVIEFYNRGGDFNEPNKDPRVRPRNLSVNQKADLAAFLRRPLTDSRVAAELTPFDRPTLYSESTRVPQIMGTGVAGANGLIPDVTALEPPLLGNRNFTVVVSRALVGAQATLVVAESDPAVTGALPVGDYANLSSTINASAYASMQLALPNSEAWSGRTLYGRIYIADPAALNGLAITPAFKITLFGESEIMLSSGFE